jgi:predicted secreted protein
MTKPALAMTLALMCLAPASAAINLHSPVIVETDAGGPVTVNAGEEFFIALQSNSSTGYAWSAHVADEKIVGYQGNVKQPAIATGPGATMPGAPGQQIFVFQASRTGATTIVFDYSRVFEPGQPPARTLSFTIDVH